MRKMLNALPFLFLIVSFIFLTIAQNIDNFLGVTEVVSLALVVFVAMLSCSLFFVGKHILVRARGFIKKSLKYLSNILAKIFAIFNALFTLILFAGDILDNVSSAITFAICSCWMFVAIVCWILHVIVNRNGNKEFLSPFLCIIAIFISFLISLLLGFIRNLLFKIFNGYTFAEIIGGIILALMFVALIKMESKKINTSINNATKNKTWNGSLETLKKEIYDGINETYKPMSTFNLHTKYEWSAPVVNVKEGYVSIKGGYLSITYKRAYYSENEQNNIEKSMSSADNNEYCKGFEEVAKDILDSYGLKGWSVFATGFSVKEYAV